MSDKLFEAESNAAWSWWNRLQPREVDSRMVPGDRAAVARLKRAANIMEAAAEPATGDLYDKLGRANPDDDRRGFSKEHATRDLPRAALLAAVLAHVRDDDRKNKSIAEAIGAPRGGEETTALVTPIRFKRLVAARQADDLLIAFRRVVALLGKTANVKDLAMQILAWTDGRTADIARTRFAFAYHGAARYAPDMKTSENPTNSANDEDRPQ